MGGVCVIKGLGGLRLWWPTVAHGGLLTVVTHSGPRSRWLMVACGGPSLLVASWWLQLMVALACGGVLVAR